MGQISGSSILDRPALDTFGQHNREWTLYRSQILSEIFTASLERPMRFVKPFFDARCQILLVFLVAVRPSLGPARLSAHGAASAASCSHRAFTWRSVSSRGPPLSMTNVA